MIQIHEYVVETSVKNPDRVKKRRSDIIDAAVHIFSKKGFHLTTTKEIADLAGINSATMFQYVKTKQDILYLVCCHIHSLIEQALFSQEDNRDDNPINRLKQDVTALISVCDKVSDYVVLMYQETSSLEKEARISFLKREQTLSDYLQKQIKHGIKAGMFQAEPSTVPLIAEDILVHAQMWAFRRWSLSKQYTLEDYIETRLNFYQSVLLRDKMT